MRVKLSKKTIIKKLSIDALTDSDKLVPGIWTNTEISILILFS